MEIYSHRKSDAYENSLAPSRFHVSSDALWSKRPIFWHKVQIFMLMFCIFEFKFLMLINHTYKNLNYKA